MLNFTPLDTPTGAPQAAPPRNARSVTLPFAPRDWQLPLMTDPAKRIVAVVHRRAGKSTGLMWRGIRRCLVERRAMPRVVHILPYGVMWARTGLWDQLTNAVREIPGADIRKASMSIVFANGATFQCGGAEVTEAADADPVRYFFNRPNLGRIRYR